MAKPGKPQQGSAVKVVEALVRPVVEGMDLRLWDVRFEKEGPDWFLRVLIDRDEPLDTDTCEAVSRAIDPLLDEADPIEQSYYLEVGSPGLGRRLTRPEHYEQLKGQKCAAHLIRPDEQGRRDDHRELPRIHAAEESCPLHCFAHLRSIPSRKGDSKLALKILFQSLKKIGKNIEKQGETDA